VGINTSAMIEAAILSKPVLSVVTPDFARTQDGTVHFRYLLPENGGFLRVASSFDEHVTQLVDILRSPDVVREQLDRFVGSFIRPEGRAQASTPRLCDALLRAAGLHVAARSETFGSRLARVALWPVAVVIDKFSPPLDADGKAGDTWLQGLGPRWERVIKRGVIRPFRFVRRGIVGAVRGLAKRSRRPARWLRAVPTRALRAVRHARYHLAVWVRSTVTPSDGTDGRP